MKKAQKQALAVGAGLAAIAAAAAGVYMLTGKNAKNRKKLGKWFDDMQRDVVNQLHKAGKVTQSSYNKVIESTAKNYKGLKNVSTAEIATAVNDLKGSWKAIAREVDNASKAMKRVVPKAAKSIAKKVRVNGVTKRGAKKSATKKRRK
jgi:hypothetical protein